VNRFRALGVLAALAGGCGAAVPQRAPIGRLVAPASPPPEPRLQPTLAYRAELQTLAGSPVRDVLSVVALAREDVWALARGNPKPGEQPDELSAHLLHFDGRAWTDHGAPSVPFAKEVFAEQHPAAVGTFRAFTLAQSPRGTLLVIGGRFDEAKRMCVLERVGGVLRERRELFAVLAGIKTVLGAEGDMTYAASPSGREVLCVGTPDADGRPKCVEVAPGKLPALLPWGQLRTLESVLSKAERGTNDSLTPIVFEGETLWKTAGWASRAADLWTIAAGMLRRWDGTRLADVDVPMTVDGVWGAGPTGDRWLTGSKGIVRFDGAAWWRVLGVEPGGLGVAGAQGAEPWVFGAQGLWRVAPDPAAAPDIVGVAGPVARDAEPCAALPIASTDASARLERVALDVEGSTPLRVAIGVVQGPRGLIWFHDGRRVVEYDGARARLVHQVPAPAPYVCWSTPGPDNEGGMTCTDRGPSPIDCRRCVAPTAPGDGAMIAAEGLLRFAGSRLSGEPLAWPGLQALAVTPSGALWAVVGHADDALPHAVVRDARGLRLVRGLPTAGYADVAARADDDVWIAGALGPLEDVATPPAQEGVLVHFDGRAFSIHRGPDALLSVAASAKDEAWAVGARGAVLRVKAQRAEVGREAEPPIANDSVVDTLCVARAGRRLGVTLRGVSVAAPDDVWIVGDRSTLLHGDDKALRRVDTSSAGREAAFMAIIAPGATPGWVVGPSGIWRIVR
jgi:hypothetical protein